jgi:hypothetical protein
MDAHPEIGISGSWVETIGDPAGQVWRYPKDHESIYASMLFENTMAHPTVIMNSTSLRDHSLEYDPRAMYAEDYDLWTRALSLVHLANIPEVLVYYRCHPSNTGKLHENAQKRVRSNIHRRLLSHFGLMVTEQDLNLHNQIGNNFLMPESNFLKSAHLWLIKLALANQKEKVISREVLFTELGKRWTHICLQSQAPLLTLLISISASPLPFWGRSGIRKIWLMSRFLVGRIRYTLADLL